MIEVSGTERSVSVYRGFLVVHDSASRDNHQELGRVPLSDIAAVITQGHSIAITNTTLVRLTQHNIPLVVLDDSYQPVAILFALQGHHSQAARFDAQVAATLPTRKRLWQMIVKAKILQQATVLESRGHAADDLRDIATHVRSGDPGNSEAHAARLYWPRLFGQSFRRGDSTLFENHMLNYGYAVLRAHTARAIVAAGLHPTIGVHHKNQSNGLRLADDMMEPFRPFVDLTVLRLREAGHTGVGSAVKRVLVATMLQDLDTDRGLSPIAAGIQRLTNSLNAVFTRESEKLDLPMPQIPKDIEVALPGSG